MPDAIPAKPHGLAPHRSVVADLRAVIHVARGDNDTATIHPKGRNDMLPVSRGHPHRFRRT